MGDHVKDDTVSNVVGIAGKVLDSKTVNAAIMLMTVIAVLLVGVIVYQGISLSALVNRFAEYNQDILNQTKDRNDSIVRMQISVKESNDLIKELLGEWRSDKVSKKAIVDGCKKSFVQAKSSLSRALGVIDDFSAKNNIVFPREFFSFAQDSFRAMDEGVLVLIQN